MIYRCCNLNRKSAILDNPAITLNGIDYLEVSPNSAPQQTLSVYCLQAAPSNLTPGNVMIVGGETITDIAVTAVAASANVLVVQTNKPGDFSTYILRLVNSATQAAGDPFEITEVLTGFDPQLAEVKFSFKVGCGPNFDCAPQPSNCSQTLPTPPPINYLAKDYGSFRTLILDRLNQLLPAWGGTSEADLGVALAELIAYKGDYLSYQQDAIATEAYIETARSRVSLRRHARLVDYHVHDGCNARTWIHLTVAADPGVPIFLDRTLTRFYTYAPGMPSSLAVGANNEESALLSGVQVFQPMQDALLYSEHNSMCFYTWGNTDCCLPQGAVEATLKGSYPNLQAGEVLIFEEVIGPQTGNPADADLRHRCALRLTQVATLDANGLPLVDPLFDQNGILISDPATQNPTPVTEIQWCQDDALPFPICISSSYLDSNGNQQTVANVSVALGNVVLADHGLSISGANLGTVPQPRLKYPPDPAADRCQPTAPTPLPVRFRPTVPDSPLTQAVPQPLAGSPVTPSVVLLGGTASVNLTDSNGLVCMTVQAADPFGWPPLFGVIVNQNQTNPANFDLSVVYNPPGGAAGVSTQVILEQFTNLSLQQNDANYVATQINSLSSLIQVPASYVPPATAPSDFPATATMLPDTGTVNLQDLSIPPVTYLTLQATAPRGWPQLFGTIVNQNQTVPANFDLSVVYNPPGGAAGMDTQVVVEQFTNLSLQQNATNYVAIQLNSFSRLIQVPAAYLPPTTAPSSFPTTATMLPNTGTVNLQDLSNPPVTYLTLQATIPAGFPQLFGVIANQNQIVPANFDLSVVYNPPGGAAGVSTQVILEQFTNLSLQPNDTNYVFTQINSLSKLIQVPVSYVPPATAPSDFPATATMLPDAGTVNLQDLSNPPLTYLTLKSTPAAGWPQLFGVLAQEIPDELSEGGQNGSATLTIGSLSPGSAAAGGPAFTLTVNGTGFLSGASVQWNGAALATTTFVSPTQLTAGVPSNLIASTVVGSVTVVNPDGTTSGPVPFTINEPSLFNLAVVYYSLSGGVGVTLPVTVEQFANVSLRNIDQVNSNLVTVKSLAAAPDPSLSAYDLMNVDPSDAVPVITLDGILDESITSWTPQPDLLGSGPSDQVFVVEIESDGTATLRFATPSDPGSELDDTNGKVPDSGTAFVADYRIGNGTAGNVGAESLVYLATPDGRIQCCTNPLPASGGTDPETTDQIRRRAPQAFLTQERSVTMADYEAVAEDNPQVDQAVASLRWTGSWYSVFIAVEPKGAGNLTSTLQKTLKANVERYRLAGQDLKLESPQYVSMQITLQVLVDPSYFQTDVEQSLLQVLGSQILPNGQKGLFYPDNFTFGQTVYLSPVYAAARSVAGVVSVLATQFQPQGVNSTQYLTAGEIKLGSLQVARLDNDPSAPDHGQLTLVMHGGK